MSGEIGTDETTGRVAYLLGPERLEWRREPIPEPEDGEVIVRVGAGATCGTDLKVYRQGGHARMLRAPCPFGHEVAGTVRATGRGVSAWRAGDRVAVANSAPCGACDRCATRRENLCRDLRYLNGAFADYLRLPARFVERSLHAIPAHLPFPVAALAEPLACVLHGLELCGPRPRSHALVLGAGPIGLLWTAVLAEDGHRVTLADPHAARLEVGRALGATVAVPVERGDSREALRRAGGTDGFDLAVDCTASPEGVASCAAALAPSGLLCAFAGPPPDAEVTLDLRALHYGEQQVRGAYHYRPLEYATALERLARAPWHPELLLSATRPLDDLSWALAEMAARRALKVALVP